MILIVSGTGTGVGKTIVTAALAALAADRGERVAVVKPAQTGVPPDEPDLDVVRRLSGVDDVHELARFPDPLSPEAAARHAGLPPLDMTKTATYVKELDATRDLVLVEGAGGLLVRYNPAGETIADLARALAAPVLIVASAGLGTLNHTALTLEALEHRGLTAAGVVLGSWPAKPGLTELSNVTDLAALVPGAPAGSGLTGLTGRTGRTGLTGRTGRTGLTGLTGRMPADAGALDRAAFLQAARELRTFRAS